MTPANPLKVAVVGHTNTGKTSLMRTLMRDATFGEVSDHPAVTRHVEGARITIDASRALELFDTPGLEDSIGLLEHLDILSRQAGAARPGVEQVRAFLAGDEAQGRFAQEAKALRQLIDSDVALYVIDARERVLPKYRDELEILSRCAKPVVPVLNFIASPQANSSPWRSALAELNLHAVAEFDTVVFDQAGEIRLLEKMRTLLDAYRPTIDNLIALRHQQRRDLISASARLIAELLVDAAAHHAVIPLAQKEKAEVDIERFRNDIRRRESRCVHDLLELHRFTIDDYRELPLAIENDQWGTDLFNPAALKQFGIRAGSAAAAGALAGLAIDAAVGGMTLGAATALGATIGAAAGFVHTHGKRMLDRARGYSELHCDRATLTLLLVRQTALAGALMRRGHAAVEPIAVADAATRFTGSSSAKWSRPILSLLDEARLKPGWSNITPTSLGTWSARRSQIIAHIADVVAQQLHPASTEPRQPRP